MKKKYPQGFTLLEMAIVLIIIGTIVGATMLGRSLLVTSKLQTIMTDADSYTSAVTNFKQTYQSLPGDMAGATNIWGAVSSCPTQQGTGTQTCNGNGDGEIGGVSSQEYEVFRFWQHLYNAGMFSQPVTGIPGSAPGSPYDSEPGVNVPVSSFQGSGFSAIWFGTITGGGCPNSMSCNAYNGSYGNVLVFGGSNGDNNITYGPLLTPDQASSIDAKIDDGVPSTGKVRIFPQIGAYNCAASGTSTTAYNLTDTTRDCALIFVTGF